MELFELIDEEYHPHDGALEVIQIQQHLQRFQSNHESLSSLSMTLRTIQLLCAEKHILHSRYKGGHHDAVVPSTSLEQTWM